MRGLAGLGWVVAAALAASACGGGQTRLGAVFAPEWEDDGGKSIAALQAKLASVPLAPGADAAVGVTDTGLVGVALAGGTPWTYAHSIDARPVLAGSVVVATGGGEVFALDALTGHELWKRRAAGVLRGIGDDGRTTVITFGVPGGGGSSILAVAHDGSVVRQLETPTAVGVPAVVGPYAFLPWQGQYVTVYDLSSGEEVARATLREQASRAWITGKALFFGEVGAFRFDDRIRLASANKASHVSLPTRELPGTPRWFVPGTDSLPAAADARDRIQLFARPTATGELGIEGGRFTATYFQIALGLDAKSGALAWVHTHDTAFLGGAAYAGGAALCDATGAVTMIDAASGATAGTVSLGRPVKACVVQTDAFTRSAAGAAARPLGEQLAAALALRDSEMATVQRVLLRELAAIDDEGVTRTVVELASDPRTSPLLLPDARSALAARRTGARSMQEALARRYDFLKDVLRAPPVGPIADALAGMGEKGAAPLLAQHLAEPADTSDDVKRVAAALGVLGGPSELPALKTFFALYRATVDDEQMVAAVGHAGAALLKLGGAEGRAIVQRAADDALTAGPVRDRLKELLAAKPAEAAKSDVAKPAAVKPAAAKAAAPKPAPTKAAAKK